MATADGPAQSQTVTINGDDGNGGSATTPFGLTAMIRKEGRTYRYYLTSLGRRTIVAALEIRDLVTIPTLA